MRAVLQRVSNARVEVDGMVVGQIGSGLLVYLSVGKDDDEREAEYIAKKICGLRVFADDAGKMNLSVLDVAGKILLISNFTLHGDTRKGRRPGFDAAAPPELAERLYEKVVELVKQKGVDVEKGIFGAHMHVSSTNDGPVTFQLES